MSDTSPTTYQLPSDRVMFKGLVKAFLWILAVGTGIFVVSWLAILPSTELRPREFLAHVKKANFDGEIVVEQKRFVGVLRADIANPPEGKSPPYKVYMVFDPMTKRYWLEQLEYTAGDTVPFREDPDADLWRDLLISWGPFLLIALLIYFSVYRNLRKAHAITLQQQPDSSANKPA